MANKLELLLEAERRGILPPEKASLLAEARKRGMVAPAPPTPQEIAQQNRANIAMADAGLAGGPRVTPLKPTSGFFGHAGNYLRGNLPAFLGGELPASTLIGEQYGNFGEAGREIIPQAAKGGVKGLYNVGQFIAENSTPGLIARGLGSDRIAEEFDQGRADIDYLIPDSDDPIAQFSGGLTQQVVQAAPTMGLTSAASGVNMVGQQVAKRLAPIVGQRLAGMAAGAAKSIAGGMAFSAAAEVPEAGITGGDPLAPLDAAVSVPMNLASAGSKLVRGDANEITLAEGLDLADLLLGGLLTRGDGVSKGLAQAKRDAANAPAKQAMVDEWAREFAQRDAPANTMDAVGAPELAAPNVPSRPRSSGTDAAAMFDPPASVSITPRGNRAAPQAAQTDVFDTPAPTPGERIGDTFALPGRESLEASAVTADMRGRFAEPIPRRTPPKPEPDIDAEARSMALATPNVPMYSGAGSPEALDKAVTFAIEKIKDVAADTPSVVKPIINRSSTYAASLGDTGRKVAREMTDVDVAASRRKGQALTEATASLRGLTNDEAQLAMKVMNGRATTNNPRIQSAVDQVRAILDRDMNENRALGVTRRLPNGERVPVGGSGEAFPQVANAEGQHILKLRRTNPNHPKVIALAERMVREGKARSVEDALLALDRWDAQQLRGVNGYFERTRVDLPDDLIEWNPRKVLPGLIERNAYFTEMVRKWGPDMGRLEVDLATMEAQFGKHKVDPLRKFFRAEFGKDPVPHSPLIKAVSDWETSSKLVGILSPIRNAMQVLPNLARYRFRDSLRTLKELPPVARRWMQSARDLENRIARSGAIHADTALTNLERPGGVAQKALTPFLAAERRNQFHTALTAWRSVERDVGELVKASKASSLQRVTRNLMTLGDGGEDAIRRRLAKAGLADNELADAIAKGGKLTDEQIDRAMILAVRDTQFPLMLSSKRLWWTRSPAMRLLFKFKTFGAEQLGLIYRDVLKEARHGNFAPMARFTVGAIIAGEVYNIARDILLGKEESLTVGLANNPDRRNAKDIAMNLLRNFADGGGVGMLADLTYGVYDFIGGPLGGTIANTFETVVDAAANPSLTPQAIREFLRREVVVDRQITAAVEFIENLLGRENRNVEYNRIRQRGFSFSDSQKPAGDQALKATQQVLFGRERHNKSADSFPLHLAAQQTAVGDIQDAAGYLRVIIENAENRKAALDKIKASMQSQSPLGSVSKSKRAAFLRQFEPEERWRIIKLQQQWMRDYQRAIREAFKGEQ